MRLLRRAIFYFIERGDYVLEIPETLPVIQGEQGPEELPDEWFCRLKNPFSGEPALSSGILHLSRAGFNANRDQMREVFNTTNQFTDISWQEFELRANEHFNRVQRQVELKIHALEVQAAEYAGLAQFEEAGPQDRKIRATMNKINKMRRFNV